VRLIIVIEAIIVVVRARRFEAHRRDALGAGAQTAIRPGHIRHLLQAAYGNVTAKSHGHFSIGEDRDNPKTEQ
jgi:hypothetical protein